MVVIIDNYDSFTYNLLQCFGELGEDVKVVRNDRTTVDAIASWSPQALVISPGPGRPSQAGISIELIRRLGKNLPILGVSLGSLCIAAAFGGEVERAPYPVHGKTVQVRHSGRELFAGLPQPLTVVCYHSLTVRGSSLPGVFTVTATTEDGLIMGLKHREYPLWGLQFHPESILTEGGKELLATFMQLAKNPRVSKRKSRPVEGI
ncbi:MAG: aminodeoxychorismate/anthranilate synthase component II [Firmicutes bacterium]|nr:aminodeoxychorismate/anthranilate synthase component II [Bacillota bacterium]